MMDKMMFSCVFFFSFNWPCVGSLVCLYPHGPIRERCLNFFVQPLYAALSCLSDTCLAFILTNGNVKNTAERLDCPFSSEAERCEAEIAALASSKTHTHTHTHTHGAMQYYN